MKRTVRWLFAVLLYYSGLFFLYERLGTRGVLILCYHRIGGEGRDPREMAMPKSFFVRQLEALAARRPIVSLDEGLDRIGGKGKPGRRRSCRHSRRRR